MTKGSITEGFLYVVGGKNLKQCHHIKAEGSIRATWIMAW